MPCGFYGFIRYDSYRLFGRYGIVFYLSLYIYNGKNKTLFAL